MHKRTSTSRFIMVDGRLIDVRDLPAGAVQKRPDNPHFLVQDPDKPVLREVSPFTKPPCPRDVPFCVGERRPKPRMAPIVKWLVVLGAAIVAAAFIVLMLAHAEWSLFANRDGKGFVLEKTFAFHNDCDTAARSA